MKAVIRISSGVLLLAALSGSASADTFVQGHTRSGGSYVQPHFRSDADISTFNNWSTRGNVNPYTGAAGTKDPYSSSRSSGFGSSNPYRSYNPYGR